MTVKGFGFELTFDCTPPRFVEMGTFVRYDPAVLRELSDAGRRISTSDVERGEVAR